MSGETSLSVPVRDSLSKEISARNQVRVEGKYIYFWHDSQNDNPKTQVWFVLAKERNGWLGRISWSGRWRCYKFSPTFNDDLDFEHQCLRDIADFIEKLTKEVRLTWKK